MSRRRKYGEDLTYAEEHRIHLEHLYRRYGHRLDMADRDWTEFCHHCKEPLGIYEEVLDLGRDRDLSDKATTVTRKLAAKAKVPALLFAPRIDRPPEVQRRIDQLNSQLRDLEAAYPISRFRARQLHPQWTPVVTLSPDEWWEEGVLILHRRHHQWCAKAKQNGEYPVDGQRLADAQHRSQLWPGGVPGQLILPSPAADVLRRREVH